MTKKLHDQIAHSSSRFPLPLRIVLFGQLFLCVISLSACSVTVGAIEGTFESIEGTTESARTSAEAASDSTSSTSPRDHHHSDGDSEEDVQEEAKIFLKRNFVYVRRDVASGGGEYLNSVAEIFGVDSSQRKAFFMKSQDSYQDLFASERDDVDKIVSRLYVLSRS